MLNYKVRRQTFTKSARAKIIAASISSPMRCPLVACGTKIQTLSLSRPVALSLLWAAGACPSQAHDFEIIVVHTCQRHLYPNLFECKVCSVLNLKADGSALNLEAAGECQGSQAIYEIHDTL